MHKLVPTSLGLSLFQLSRKCLKIVCGLWWDWLKVFCGVIPKCYDVFYTWSQVSHAWGPSPSFFNMKVIWTEWQAISHETGWRHCVECQQKSELLPISFQIMAILCIMMIVSSIWCRDKTPSSQRVYAPLFEPTTPKPCSAMILTERRSKLCFGITEWPMEPGKTCTWQIADLCSHCSDQEHQ